MNPSTETLPPNLPERGWFESSYDLQQGLQVLELPGLPLEADWAELTAAVLH